MYHSPLVQSIVDIFILILHICFRCTHNTPSRMPLIWRCPEDGQESTIHPTTVSVPALLVVSIFIFYICAGAIIFSSTSGWSFLDSIYFCFITVSTIGVGDKLPQSSEFHAQLQLFACCLYLIVGLIVVSMCFSLVQEEVSNKCRQIADNIGIARHQYRSVITIIKFLIISILIKTVLQFYLNPLNPKFGNNYISNKMTFHVLCQESTQICNLKNPYRYFLILKS